jgi:DNA mismatch endonuclease, patch repair protein
MRPQFDSRVVTGAGTSQSRKNEIPSNTYQIGDKSYGEVGINMDTITRSERSLLMSRIRSKDTQPELVVRSILHECGYRFRLHRKDLAGRPDIVLPRHRKIVFVHGCFWHGHTCPLASKPKSNDSYWSSKIQMNRTRDERNLNTLISQEWKVLELWECDIRKADGLEQILRKFMRS